MPSVRRRVRIPVGEDARPFNVWDCFALGGPGEAHPGWPHTWPQRIESRTRLFGNYHIGVRELCNLQLPGMISFDKDDAWIEHVYARHNLDLAVCSPRLRASLHMWASTTSIELDIGDRGVMTWSLAELLAQEPWEPPSVAEAKLPENLRADYRKRVLARREEGVYPHWVPTRQNVSVLVESAPLERLVEALDTIRLTCWVHLEGYRQLTVY